MFVFYCLNHHFAILTLLLLLQERADNSTTTLTGDSRCVAVCSQSHVLSSSLLIVITAHVHIRHRQWFQR